MALISCQSLGKSFGSRDIFQNVSLTIDEDERLGLIGPNGAGKSTLLKLLSGLLEPDSGTISYRKNLRLAYVPQSAEFEEGARVLETVAAAVEGLEVDEAERQSRATIALSRVGFTDFGQDVAELSGGWKKRLSIAREAVREPDLLLLDEPTNHLDLEGILWLEKFLQSAPFACVICSHDRYFLDNVVNGMAEISSMYPDGLFRSAGSYTDFLEKKNQFIEAQTKLQDGLGVQVRKEIEWLRRRPKARTTKSKARIDEAGRLMTELADVKARNAPQRAAQVEFSTSDRKTKRLAVAEKVSKGFSGRPLFSGVNFTLTPGTRMGIAGRNGSGKTTLLRLLRGTLEPDSGEIRLADGLKIVYFDQNREQLDPEVPLRKALCPDGDSVMFQDKPIHVNSWARRFLFRSDQLDLPVGRLSGGEQARVLIARLMLQRCDLLLLDEPTNDLDISTLEVLEDNLVEFPGALALVTHDRYMLDRVSTQILGLDPEGGATIFADYGQWEQALLTKKAKPKESGKPQSPAVAQPPARKKLSYLESREWDQIETVVHHAEEKLHEQRLLLEDPSVVSDGSRIQAVVRALDIAQAEVDRLYARWAELEKKQSG